MLEASIRMLAELDSLTTRQAEALKRAEALKSFYLQTLWALAKKAGGQTAVDRDQFIAMSGEDFVSLVFSSDETKLIVTAFKVSDGGSSPRLN